MNHNKAFGVVLREERKHQKMSQETLALNAGLDRTYISLLELGQHSPSLDTMMCLSEQLKVRFHCLAFRVDRLLDEAKN